MDISLKTHKQLIVVFFVSFILISFSIAGSTYADALFLSYYPRTWLIYSFIITPIAMMALYFFATPLLAKATPKQSCLLILGSGLLVFLVYSLLPLQIYILPFILSILMVVLIDIIMAICWNAIATSLDILEFKKYSSMLNLTGALGAVITAFLSPVITYFFHLPGLFYTSLIGIFIIALCLLNIQPLPAPPKKTKEVVLADLHRQPFFIYLFLIIIFGCLIDTLSDFAFKAVLMGAYSKEGIADFLSYFKGISSLLGMLLQFIAAPLLISRFSLIGILLILPGVTLAFSGGLLIFPHFWLYILLRGSFKVLKNNFDGPGMEMIINPYPSLLRSKASFFLKGYAKPIGYLLAIPFIYALTNWLPLYISGVIMLVFSLGWIFLLRRTKKEYQNLLHLSLKEQRFSSALLATSPEMLMFVEQENFKALTNNDLSIVQAGLSFFSEINSVSYLDGKEVANIIIPLLKHPNEEIRYKATLSLLKLKADNVYEPLLEQLKQETNSLVGWELVHTIFSVCDLSTKTIDYDFWLSSNYSYHIGFGLIALDCSGKEPLQDKAAAIIRQMFHSSVDEKIIIARSEKFLRQGPEQMENFCKLIEDKSNELSITAMRSVRESKDDYLISTLIGLLEIKPRAYYAQKALVKFGEKTFAHLARLNADSSYLRFRGMVNIFAATLTLESLNKLIELSKLDKISLRLYIAQSIRTHFLSATLTREMNEQIIKMIAWEAEIIHHLLRLHIPEENDLLAIEVNIQLRLNREIFLIWLSLILGQSVVASVEHYIINPENANKTDLAKSYEFLDSLCESVSLKKSVALISRNYKRDYTPDNEQQLGAAIFTLATHNLSTMQRSSMNLMDKVFFLRKVGLFQEVPFDSLQAIAEVAQQRDMSANEYIFKDCEEPDGFYCLISGAVEIRKAGVVFAQLNESDYFGELSLLDDSPRTADALALQDGSLLYIDKEEFIRLLEDIPSVMRAVLKQILKYLRNNMKMIAPQ